jgi:fumarate reductase subunit C
VKARSGVQPEVVRHFRYPLPRTWWLGNRRYLLYMLRDFSALPFSLWLLWFLIEVGRLRAGPAGYHPNASRLFVAFSVVCLLFAALHSVTFLNLSAAIVRVSLRGRTLSASLIRAVNFGLWALASVVVVAGLVYLARPR